MSHFRKGTQIDQKVGKGGCSIGNNWARLLGALFLFRTWSLRVIGNQRRGIHARPLFFPQLIKNVWAFFESRGLEPNDEENTTSRVPHREYKIEEPKPRTPNRGQKSHDVLLCYRRTPLKGKFLINSLKKKAREPDAYLVILCTSRGIFYSTGVHRHLHQIKNTKSRILK